MKKINVGQVLYANFYGIPEEKFNNEKIKNVLKNACNSGSCTILNYSDFIFPNNGYTISYVLAESHAALHTYQEYYQVFIDIFTCGEKANPIIIFEIMKEYFSPTLDTEWSIIKR